MQNKENKENTLKELFSSNLEFEYAVAKDVLPNIRRIVAPNPSPYTLYGTGTYIVGKGEVAVVDPGPNIKSHIEAILKITRSEKITHILVTHTHSDHSPAAKPLAKETGAIVMGYGPHGNFEGGEEGADYDFDPPHKVVDGEIIKGLDWNLECIHTPGHTSNHICYNLLDTGAVFTGDHIMGWSTTVVSPPDGNMADYFRSLEKMFIRNDKFYIPTHGSIIKNPKNFVKALIGHRKMRESQIKKYLEKKGKTSIIKLVERMYPKLDKRLVNAAGRSVLAHLLHMEDLGIVKCVEGTNNSSWHIAD